MSKLVSWLFRGISTLIVLVIILFFFLHLPGVQTFIAHRIASSIVDKSQGSIRFEKVDFNILKGVQLYNVQLNNGEDKILGRIEQVIVSPKSSFVTLLRGSLSLNRVTLKGLDLELERDTNGRIDILDLFQKENKEPKNKPSRLDIELSHLNIRKARICYFDRLQRSSLEAIVNTVEIEINEILSGNENSLINLNRFLLDAGNISLINFNSDENVKKDSSIVITSPVQNFIPELRITDLMLINSSVYYVKNNDKPKEAFDIDFLAKDIYFKNENNWSGSVEDISFKTKEFSLDHFDTDIVQVTGDEIKLDGGNLSLNGSSVRFNLGATGFEDFSSVSTANYRIELKPSHFRIRDLFFISSDFERLLGKEPISDKEIQIEGSLRINNEQIDARGISFWMNGDHYFEGNAELYIRSPFKRSTLFANVRDLRTNFTSIESLFNNIKMPNELKRLGELEFVGKFEGELNDFHTVGEMTSGLGDLAVNIYLDQQMGRSDSLLRYSGHLGLKEFDLGGLLANTDFGRVTGGFQLANGSGVDLINSSADIIAEIKEFYFKEYNYRDAAYNGYLSSKEINGSFIIKDENVDFSFQGNIDLSREVPIFDFTIDANRINLCVLNITDFPCELAFKSDFNLQGKNASAIEGSANIDKLIFVYDTSSVQINKIRISSNRIGSRMDFVLLSDYLDAHLQGEFNLLQFARSNLALFALNNQKHEEIAGLNNSGDTIFRHDVTYSMRIKKANPVLRFLNVEATTEGEIKMNGYLKTDGHELRSRIIIPGIEYKGVVMKDLDVYVESGQNKSVVHMSSVKTEVSNVRLESMSFEALLTDSDIDWDLELSKDDKNYSSIQAKSRIWQDGYLSQLTSHKILLDGEDWKIDPKNILGIFPQKIEIDQFILTGEGRSISVDDLNQRGLEIKMVNFEIKHLNDFINYDKLFFSGKSDATVRVEDVFTRRNAKMLLSVPAFRINDVPYGELNLLAQQSAGNLIDMQLGIVKDSQELRATGYIDIDAKFVNADLDIRKYPMDFFEFIIQDGISETTGTTDIVAKIHGDLSDLKLSGRGIVKDAGVRIDYLGAHYRVDDQVVRITEDYIDLTNMIMRDERNNQAIIRGGLRHNMLADIRADLSISSPQFIALNTTNIDNPIYYGLGQGDITISFSGPFDAIDIRVNAITGLNTQLFIPITDTEYGIDESFVRFDYRDTDVDSVHIRDLVKKMQESGVDFEMNLTFTPEAEVQVIYDPVTNNVLIGRGRGSLRLKIKRDGEFSVYGNYYVESGRYLYTAYGFIAKPFEIRNGGTVTWTGDPINATLNVTADYPGLRAPLNVFLREYIQSSSLDPGEFTQAREVDLTLLLSGTLFTPTINFGIDFPNLTGELRTLANSKVRTLQTSENGINNQVVGLLVFRNFLPDDNPFQLSGQTIGQTGNNTITEFLTSQLSLLFTEYLSEKLKDNGLISGIDFDIAVAQNTSVLTDQNADVFTGFVDFVPDEIQLNLRNRFKNDNFVLNIGGNYVRENPIGTAENYLTGDFALDWFITDDKRLKLRFYGNYDFDEAYGQRKQKYGFGLNYRREFGSINNFESVLEELIKEINEESKTSGSTSNK